MGLINLIFLRSIQFNSQNGVKNKYPFNVADKLMPDTLDFPTPVTFFVGENGSGKSTILEAIAAKINLPAIGGEAIAYDKTLDATRQLSKYMKLVWNRRTHRGFFMRSEDFFNFTRRIFNLSQELAAEAQSFENSLSGYGLQLAQGTVRGQRQALIEKYGEDLQANSHGEAILRVLIQRIVPDGIYLLDEPETPFSPQRQLSLISIIKQMVEENCQFIIATHSPILLAFPNAAIYSFDEVPVQIKKYDELEHVNLTRDFLNTPEAFLRHL
mgnify:CR=1 FL=1